MMKRSAKRWLALSVAIVLITGFIAYRMTSPYLCVRIPTAKMTQDGKVAVAQFYRKTNGQFLLVFKKTTKVTRANFAYRILPNTQEVYWYTNSRIAPVPLLPALAWDTQKLGVHLGYIKGIKTLSIRDDTDSRLIIRSNHIEFNGLEKEHIVIDW